MASNGPPPDSRSSMAMAARLSERAAVGKRGYRAQTPGLQVPRSPPANIGLSGS